MANDEIYRPETITEQPLATQTEAALQSIGSNSSGQSGNSEAYSPAQTLDKQFPIRFVAAELMSTVLDTQTKKIKGNFSFSALGAITIGKYIPGESGQVDISGNGITAMNLNGETTFAIDATNGNATFKGTIQAGTVIAGDNNVQVGGDANGGYIFILTLGVPGVFMGVI